MNLLTDILEALRTFAANFSYNVAYIENFLREHYSPFYLLGVVVVFMLWLRIMKSSRNRTADKTYQSTPNVQFVSATDMQAIAGDNPIATKLDLARAYIEMGKKHLAKNILLNVQKQGTDQQKQEAKKLFETL